MKQDEITDMARQAGATEVDENDPQCFIGCFAFDVWELEAFAKLVASAATVKKHQELYRLAEDAPVRGDARETRQNILHAIRARGEPTSRGEA
jgi:hypothetical protein